MLRVFVCTFDDSNSSRTARQFTTDRQWCLLLIRLDKPLRVLASGLTKEPRQDTVIADSRLERVSGSGPFATGILKT